MKAVHRSRVLSFFLIAAYLLAACRGVPLGSTDRENFSPLSLGKTGGVLLVGDQVELHELIRADGKLGVREIEKSVSPLEHHSIWSGSEHSHDHHSDDDCHGGPCDGGHHGNSHHGSGDD